MPKVELELAGLKLAGVLEQAFLLLPVAAVLAVGGVLRPEPESSAGPQVAPAAPRPPPPPPPPARGAPASPPLLHLARGRRAQPAARRWRAHLTSPSRVHRAASAGAKTGTGGKRNGRPATLEHLASGPASRLSCERALRPAAAHFCIAARTGPADRRCRPPPQFFLLPAPSPAHFAVLLAGWLLRSRWWGPGFFTTAGPCPARLRGCHKRPAALLASSANFVGPFISLVLLLFAPPGPDEALRWLPLLHTLSIRLCEAAANRPAPLLLAVPSVS